MKLEYYITFNLMAFLMLYNLLRSTRRIDENIEYNNLQIDFVVPMKWMKKLLRLRSELVPKYVYIRSFSIVSAFSGIACSITYFFANHNENVAKALALVQICYYFFDLICFFVYLSLYNSRLLDSKNNKF